MRDKDVVGVGEMASSQVPPDLFCKRQLELVVGAWHDGAPALAPVDPA
jgi:hypothetical protein